jgi:hypothetical protein
MNAQARQNPITDKCADNTYDQIPDEPEAPTSHDLAGQPAGENTN